MKPVLVQVALKVGSCAARACEPRQVRKEAAVSKYFCVPQINLAGVGCARDVCSVMSRVGARSSTGEIGLIYREFYSMKGTFFLCRL